MFTLGGLVSFPLAVAIGALDQVDSVSIGLILITGAVSVVVYVSACWRRATWLGSTRYTRAVR